MIENYIFLHYNNIKLGCLFCLNVCGHQHSRIFRVIYLKPNSSDQGFVRDFRTIHMGRHFEQCHKLGKSTAALKKSAKQESLKIALIGAVSNHSRGYSIFQKKSMHNFYNQSCEYSKDYRENPIDFLNFDRKSLARQVKTRAQKLMYHMKQAVNHALEKQAKAIDEECARKTRCCVTKMADHARFKNIKKKLGAVNIFMRITNNTETNVFSLPISIYDTEDTKFNASHRGTTARANAHQIMLAIKNFFGERNLDFLCGTYDGGILDKKKGQFVSILKDLGCVNEDILSFTCTTHGTALVVLLSVTRPARDYGLKLENQDPKEPDPSRKNPDAIWFNREKEDLEKSFKTYIAVNKLLNKKPKRKQVSFADFTHLLALRENQIYKESPNQNPNRTNSVYLRWRNRYFDTKNDHYARECPLQLIRESDKKLRRHYQKAIKILDNLPYIRMVIQRGEFKDDFERIVDPVISAEFEHMLGQWCALTEYLYSICDSSKNGNNATLMRCLLITLKALLEHEYDHNIPLSNILIRFFHHFSK